MADIVAFGGAEALETVGCPRVTVQVGRADAKVSDTKSNSICWQAEEGILPENYKSVTLNAFKSSGLDARDIVLILGGLGEINRVSDETRKDRYYHHFTTISLSLHYHFIITTTLSLPLLHYYLFQCHHTLLHYFPLLLPTLPLLPLHAIVAVIMSVTMTPTVILLLVCY